jgi:hypothetical protein
MPWPSVPSPTGSKAPSVPVPFGSKCPTLFVRGIRRSQRAARTAKTTISKTFPPSAEKISTSSSSDQAFLCGMMSSWGWEASGANRLMRKSVRGTEGSFSSELSAAAELERAGPTRQLCCKRKRQGH